MAFIFNGTTIPSNTGTVRFNGIALDKVVFNGVTVWEALINPLTYRYEYQPGTFTLLDDPLLLSRVTKIEVRHQGSGGGADGGLLGSIDGEVSPDPATTITFSRADFPNSFNFYPLQLQWNNGQGGQEGRWQGTGGTGLGYAHPGGGGAYSQWFLFTNNPQQPWTIGWMGIPGKPGRRGTIGNPGAGGTATSPQGKGGTPISDAGIGGVYNQSHSAPSNKVGQRSNAPSAWVAVRIFFDGVE